ncbi:alpha/beta hydrolase [Schaalia sp. lx-100]|uniref:alpha/beta hydrolase n=1 Tax=Schaalia sp. lx-100 TaxID=2899081 RepID=UPI001E42F094|nr:alpha/beta hydrolase [Schaalia sp. lx-100]MCD4557823.1 alpha/beta hydrolase [Schaalia sp. lx-100]
MSDVQIVTPRGSTLCGTFINPVDTKDAAVVFSHSVFENRNSGEYFDRLAAAYRAAGYATLIFDYSGHGASDDDIITRELQVEDLRAASGWVSDQGFSRQIIHGHAYGALVALSAHPVAATTMVLFSPVLGPRTYQWESIFSTVQLDELDKHGVTTIPDDLPGNRQNFTISKQTLVDLSMVDQDSLFRRIDYPILIIHDGEDVETGLTQITHDVFPLMADGSRVHIMQDTHFTQDSCPDTLVERVISWAQQHVPARHYR